MKLFKKNGNKETHKLPMTGKVKKGFRFYCVAVMAVTMVLGTSMTAFAANDPIQVVNNLSDFIFGLVRAVGMIMLGFGIVQVGLSLKSHDPSQRANGFLTLAGGVVITFAKEILTLIAGYERTTQRQQDNRRSIRGRSALRNLPRMPILRTEVVECLIIGSCRIWRTLCKLGMRS